MNAIIYCRVSTQEQVLEGNSLLSQERMCRQYAKNNGYEIDRVFVEEGESAKTTARTELQKMMKYCKMQEGKIDALLFYKIDRLSRDSHDYAGLKIFFASCRIKLVSITELIENNPLGHFIEHTLAGIAQLDNEIRGERSKNGMIEALKQGRWTFQAPFGFKTVGSKGNSNIVPVGPFAGIINKIFEQLAKGYTTVEDARRDSFELGLVNKDGKTLISSVFHKMIRNPIYKGYIEVPSMGIYQKGIFPSIVKPEVFDQVQELLTGKKKKIPIYKKLNADFPLRGVLKCPKCGKMLTASWAKPNIGHYRCSICKNINLNKKVCETHFEEYLQTIVWNQITLDIVKESLLLNWESHKKAYGKELVIIDKQRTDIKLVMDKIIEKNINGIISDTVAKRTLTDNEKKLSELNVEAHRYISPAVMEEELLTYCLDFMKNLVSIWNKLEIEPLSRLQKLLFPEGLVFLGGKFTTIRKSCVVELNDLVSVDNSSLVSSLYHRWNTYSRVFSKPTND